MLKASKILASAFVLAMAPALPIAALAPSPALAQISIGVSVNFAPPALPIYVQPPLPAPGYIWSPGYWAWDSDDEDYYWVPGAWVTPPRFGLLWTPGYWGWSDGAYLFRTGYWGSTVGFYGGVNYGFGYTGSGYYGGEWRGNQFYYNRSVSNVTNVNVTNVYNKTVIINNNAPRTSFSGGPNGVQARPTPTQVLAATAPHVAPTVAQVQHVNAAKTDPQARFKANQGKPAQPAAAKPLGGGAPLGNNGQAQPQGVMEKPAAAPGTAEPGAGGQKAHELPKPAAARPLDAVRARPQPAAPERRVIERPQPAAPRMEQPRPQPAAPRMEQPRPQPAAPRPAPQNPQPCRGPQCPK